MATVLVTGAEFPGPLAAVRALRAAGHRVSAAVADPATPSARTRAAAVEVLPDPASAPAAFAAAAGALAERVGAVAVLPGTEAGLLALAEHRARIPDAVAVGAPSLARVRRATDKLHLLELAERAGVGAPPGVVLAAGDRPPPSIGYPCLVKPLRSETPEAGGGVRHSGVLRALDAAGLQRALRAMPGEKALVQRAVDGRLVTLDGLAWEGEFVGVLQKVAVRIWPPEAGLVAYARTVPVDNALLQPAREVIRALEWSGPVNLQFIRTPAGRAHLIDVNPRIYHALALAPAAGVDLIGDWVALLCGRRPPATVARPGVFFRSDEEELRRVAQELRRGRVRTALRIARPRRATAHSLLAARDLRPFLGMLRQAVRG